MGAGGSGGSFPLLMRMETALSDCRGLMDGFSKNRLWALGAVGGLGSKRVGESEEPRDILVVCERLLRENTMLLRELKRIFEEFTGR